MEFSRRWKENWKASRLRRRLRESALSVLGGIVEVPDGLYALNAHGTPGKPESVKRAEHLLSVLDRNYNLVSFEEGIADWGCRSWRGDVSLFFTFDDGLVELEDWVADKLARVGIAGCVFVNPGLISRAGKGSNREHPIWQRAGIEPGRLLDWDGIGRLVESGWSVGSHGMSHRRLVSEAPGCIEYEIEKSRVAIEKRIGVECRYFAWPFGGWSDISEPMLRAALDVYDYVFMSDPGPRCTDEVPERVINRRHVELHWPPEHVKACVYLHHLIHRDQRFRSSCT